MKTFVELFMQYCVDSNYLLFRNLKMLITSETLGYLPTLILEKPP